MTVAKYKEERPIDEQVYSLHQLIDYQDNQIRSRVLSKKMGIDLPLIIYAVARGESISMEETNLAKLIQVLDGTLELVMKDRSYQLVEGDLMVIPPKTAHEINVIEACKFLQIETV